LDKITLVTKGDIKVFNNFPYEEEKTKKRIGNKISQDYN